LVFVSNSKRDIATWSKKLKELNPNIQPKNLDLKDMQVNFNDKRYQTLFERLGGFDAINAVVEGMYQKIFSDPDLADFFRKTNKENQMEM
jgi:hemoglobin